MSSTTGRKTRAIGINHVALEVADVDAALEFYGQLFELKLRGRHAGMAFVDLGDQFLALSTPRSQAPDRGRHFGLVVDDREPLRGAVEAAGGTLLESGGLDFLDPWGNHVQVVVYGDIQFSKSRSVLRGMGLDDLDKTPEALAELAAKGMSSDPSAR